MEFKSGEWEQNKTQLYKKVALDLLSDPFTLLPVAGGLTALLANWGMDLQSTFALFLGGMGLLLGAGTFFTRLLLNSDDLAEKAVEETLAEREQAAQERLDDLERQLEEDGDPRTQELLKTLRSLKKTFEEESVLTDLNPASQVEIRAKVDRLFRGCVSALVRSYKRWEQAQLSPTERTKQLTLLERDQDLNDVTASVAALEKVVSEGRRKARKGEQDQADLARLRDELDQSLRVARKVEARMKALDDELSGTREGLGDAQVDERIYE